jgi:hypothetical protein
MAVKELVEVPSDRLTPEGGSSPTGDPAEAWIHDLAGEWQSRWERVQNPQALSGAALLK